MKDNAIVLFLRYPEKGKVKTRLARDIGVDLAYELYVCFIRDLIERLRKVNADIVIAATGRKAGDCSDAPFVGASVIAQRGAGLGSRMHNAFTDVFSKGYCKAVLTGSDIPGLDADTVRSSFCGLENHDLVLGPSLDGGYYLIARNAGIHDISLFENIPWSTPRVFPETRRRINDLGLSLFLLPYMEDIDDVSGLRRFYEKQQGELGGSFTLRCIEKHKEKIYGRI